MRLKACIAIFRNFPPLRWIIYTYQYLVLCNSFPKTQFDYGCIVKDSTFSDHARISHECSISQSHLGRYTYVGNRSVVSRTEIGSFTCIGPGVLVNLGSHPTNRKSIHPAFYSPRKRAARTFVTESSYEEYDDVKIGNDVWIGANVVILGGVNIPDGVIISAGSIVRKSDILEPYGIYGGAPITLIKMRKYAADDFRADTWWELDDQILRGKIDEFS